MIPFITSYLQSVTQDVKGTYVSFVFRVIEACMKHPFFFPLHMVLMTISMMMMKKYDILCFSSFYSCLLHAESAAGFHNLRPKQGRNGKQRSRGKH